MTVASSPHGAPASGPSEWPRLVAMLGVFLTAGAAIVWLVLPPPPPPKRPPLKPRIEVAGRPVPLERDPVVAALELVRVYATSKLVLRLPDGRTEALYPARLGAEIDRLRVGELVKEAMRPKSALGRAHAAARRSDPTAVLALPLPIRIDTERAVAALVGIKDSLDKPASDAVVDLQTRKLVPETIGYRLDVYGTLARIDAALRSGAGVVDAEVTRIRPRVIAAELGNVKFDAVLGYFETRYSRSARSRARTYNLRLAASRLDGTVLLPGEVFDFNATVGPRDEAHGYKVAPVIAEGELVDGIGGGTCQISGTLHGAAFFAGLEIVRRRPHSRPSTYIKLGMDAAVAYPSINFKMKNPFDHPVVLHETVKDGVVRAEVLGPRRKRTVSFFRRIDEIIPFEELERESAKLPEGKRVLSQRGVPGFKTTVYRVVRDGAHAVRDVHRDHYPPTAQIVLVGTGPDDAKGRARDDNHLEYVADEYLVVTQGPKIRSASGTPTPGGGTIESRVPGKTGRYGWQEKAGMPVWKRKKPEDDEG